MFNTLFKKELKGINIPHYKNTMDCNIETIPVPKKVIISMSQHLGPPCKCLVKSGDEVFVGTKIGDNDAFLTAPIHSSVSGKVSGIIEITNAFGQKITAVEIISDGKQQLSSEIKIPKLETHSDFVTGLRQSGAVGLGGAGFPTHIKTNPKNLNEVNTLIINAAECEPFITSDYRNMIEHTKSIINGIKLIQKYMDIPIAYIGIEDNKPNAIKVLKNAIGNDNSIKLHIVKSIYPQGGEKVLIYSVTNKIVGEGMLPSDVGVVVFNITTVKFIDEYFKTGIPLINKVLTVDGDCISSPKNVECPIGTLYIDLIEYCGGLKKQLKQLIMGGPMMGINISDLESSVVKNNNAILAFSSEFAIYDEPSPCIKCCRCVKACPFNLLPNQMEKAALNNDIDELKKLSVNSCMECGCCTYVCPAKRQLVAAHKIGKKLLRG